jgi:hypothetical protein
MRWSTEDDIVFIGQYHLMPAPSDRAIVARSDTATVKRARFAFTTHTS